MGQIAKMIFEEQQGSLPNTSKVNLKEEDMEHYEAITLINEKELEEPKRVEADAKELDELVEKENG